MPSLAICAVLNDPLSLPGRGVSQLVGHFANGKRQLDVVLVLLQTTIEALE